MGSKNVYAFLVSKKSLQDQCLKNHCKIKIIARSLYGGLGVDAIKARKGLTSKEQIMDRMNTTELAANQFRMTHTREKLKLKKIKNQRDAMETHEMVGREVRAAIAKIGVAMPENIPPAEPIKNVEKRLKKAKPQLLLDEKDSGLLPHNSSNNLEP